MAVSKKIINFLEKKKAKYDLLEHKKVYTAIDKARTLKIKDGIAGKTVVLKANGNPFVVLTSSDKVLDLLRIKKIIDVRRKKEGRLAAGKIGFVGEKWIKDNMKGAKAGAVPPFGELWKIPVIAETSFLKNKNIILNSGDHRFSFKMSSAQLKKLESDLTVGSFSKKRSVKKKTRKKK